MGLVWLQHVGSWQMPMWMTTSAVSLDSRSFEELINIPDIDIRGEKLTLMSIPRP